MRHILKEKGQVKRFKECRLFPRLRVSLPIKYELSRGAWEKTTTKDISLEGACIHFPRQFTLEQGNRLWLEIQIPNSDRATNIEVEVIWRHKSATIPNGNYDDVGVKFIRVDPFDMRQLLDQLVRP